MIQAKSVTYVTTCRFPFVFSRCLQHSACAMDETHFRAALAQFVKSRPSKTDAARHLSLTRQDLYRYLDGKTSPREPRRDDLLQKIQAAHLTSPHHVTMTEFPRLDQQSVTQLRNYMLHLVSLIDLDETVKRGNGRKDDGTQKSGPTDR